MKMFSTEEDRSLPYVKAVVFEVVLGIIGVYLRFADFPYSSQVADIIFGIAIIMAFKTVFDWMEKF